MDFVLIYGPMAVGKLTVANELVKLTGYKLFHNQLTVDLVKSIFDWGTEPYNKLNHKFRVELIEEAAKSNLNGLIFTFCYAFPQDTNFIKLLKRKVEKHGAKFYLVQLSAEKESLFKRVKSANRENFDKLKSKKSLKKIFAEYDLFSTVPKLKSLKIDNTTKSPRKVAGMIKSHYKLKSK
jgi:RNase adaptor protein for sRNA GlmZ degradation